MAAQAVLSFRHGDGSNQLSGYADTSHYQPVNTPDQIIDPLHWQPLRVNGKVQKYLTPHWGDGHAVRAELWLPVPARRWSHHEHQ